MGDRNRSRGRQTPRSDRAGRLAIASRDLERTLEGIDLDREAATADAVIVALRAADYAYTMETGADGRPSVREFAE